MTQAEREKLASTLTAASSDLREAQALVEMGLCALVLGQPAASAVARGMEAASSLDHAKRHLRRLSQ